MIRKIQSSSVLTLVLLFGLPVRAPAAAADTTRASLKLTFLSSLMDSDKKRGLSKENLVLSEELKKCGAVREVFWRGEQILFFIILENDSSSRVPIELGEGRERWLEHLEIEVTRFKGGDLVYRMEIPNVEEEYRGTPARQKVRSLIGTMSVGVDRKGIQIPALPPGEIYMLQLKPKPEFLATLRNVGQLATFPACVAVLEPRDENEKTIRLFNMASRASIRRDYATAFSLANEVLQVWPEDGSVLSMLAFCCEKLGRYELALEYHRKHMDAYIKNRDPNGYETRQSDYFMNWQLKYLEKKAASERDRRSGDKEGH